jgi:voltage-gated potassium channel
VSGAEATPRAASASARLAREAPPTPAHRVRRRALGAAAAVLVALFVIAVAFFHLVEHYSLLDAIFVTIVTISTISTIHQGEPTQIDPAGKVFAILFVIAGFATLTFALWHGAEMVVEQQLWDFLGRRRRMKAIAKLCGHHIVCGYGRMGQEIVRQLTGHGANLVVIERDAELAQSLQEAGILYVAGNATDDDVLLAGGIKAARSLVAVTSTDEDNLFLVISARVLNPELYIVARCASPQAADKFRRAGADRVVSPYIMGGRQMAAAVMRPVMADFLDLVLQAEETEVDVAEVTVEEGAPFAGLSLGEAAVREHCGAGIVAVRGPDGRFHTNPPPDYVLKPGDVLIALGPPEQLTCLENLCGCAQQ